MRTLILTLVFIVGAASGALALKWSDQDKARIAINAIKMADAIDAYTTSSITCQAHLDNAPRGTALPEISLSSGTAFTNLLSAMTTKLSNDRTAAQTYLSSVNVTND